VGAVISVIIPARDCEAVIGPCLDSLASQTLRPDEVIVVNDGSSDRTVEVVSDGYPWARLISLDESRGFTGACLAGFRETKGDWIAILNSDAEARPDWLKEVMAAAESDPMVGMVASRVLMADPTETIDSLGLMIRRSGMAYLRRHRERERPEEDSPDCEEVFGPAGSAALYRRAMLDETGFFEEDFFIYYEDVDLAFRARWMGWKCLLANRGRVIHHHSHTMGRAKSDKRYLLQRNRIRTMIRNWPNSWLLLFSPLVIAYDLGSIVLAIFEGSGAASIRARVDALKAMTGDLEARRKLMGAAGSRHDEIRRWLKTDHLPFEKKACSYGEDGDD
jgi:GT2 family glycosyltransferase